MTTQLFRSLHYSCNRIVGVINLLFVVGMVLRLNSDQHLVGWLARVFETATPAEITLFISVNFMLACLFMLFIRRTTIGYTIWGLGPMFFYTVASIIRFIIDTNSSGMNVVFPIIILTIGIALLAIQHLATRVVDNSAQIVARAMSRVIDERTR